MTCVCLCLDGGVEYGSATAFRPRLCSNLNDNINYNVVRRPGRDKAELEASVYVRTRSSLLANGLWIDWRILLLNQQNFIFISYKKV